ncbi:lipopolysaccharide assembly protein LapA domain-containing protein [Kitasatospora sp. NBC_01287]|uniref:lipopolysaccharide assembly protein LapA domain-containing protein n=1 Tax=Kitasatospora sp. NBC_01287 TaxID=2903573 RepID=UPI0022509E8C|nr:lipopolysaccharide assembly protein LapA domain-containing protein [Kitasatospora sp. NBC_01287]MCX4750794.1 lipopolysaccharide assembly protein LapA domain-containing protein [Kitasatospora sp. NBC_01287]
MAQNTPPPHRPPGITVKGRDVRFRTIGLAVLAVLAIWFIAANTGSVSVRLWIPTVTLPLWAVLTVTLLVGLLIGYVLGRRRTRP